MARISKSRKKVQTPAQTHSELERVGDVTLPITSDRYINPDGSIDRSASVLWLRFPMYSADDAESDTKFGVCRSGDAIIVDVFRKGEHRYYSVAIGEEMLRKIDEIDAARRAAERETAG